METVNEMFEHPICSYSDIQQNKYVLGAVKYNSVSFYQMQNNTFIKQASGSSVWKKKL